jgi:hypothetical protein
MGTPRVGVVLVLGTLALTGCGSGSSRSAATRTSSPSVASPGAPLSQLVAGAGALPPAASVSAQLFVRAADRRVAPGTVVRPANLGASVFADARHGFTLASIGYDTYPAATIDGGRTWRIDGPVLPIPAARAGVTQRPPRGQPGVAGPNTYFAAEGLQGTTVVEVTTDAGKHWWQALLPGGVVFVGAFDGELTAIIAVPTGNPQSAGVEFWAYHSKSGRRWDYDAGLDRVG